MSQAYNLSQLANNVDTTGKAILTGGAAVTGTLPVGNGGTGVAALANQRVLLGGSAVSTVGTTTSGGATATAGMFLSYRGDGNAPTWESAPVTGINYERWTTNSSWTVPGGVTKCLVLCIGGGGGANGIKGGRGARVVAHVSGLTSGQIIPITVGSGGNGDFGGAPYYNTNGGASSFGSYVISNGGVTAAPTPSDGAFTLNSTGGVTTRIYKMFSPFFWGQHFLYGSSMVYPYQYPTSAQMENGAPYGYSSSTFDWNVGAQIWNETLNIDPGWNQICVFNDDPKVRNAGIGGFVAITY